MVSSRDLPGCRPEPTLRVLHLGKYYPPAVGGMEVFLRDLAVAQVRQGLSVAALVHQQPPRSPGATELREGVRVIRAANLGQLAYAPLSPAFPWHLRRLLREFRPHLLHLHLPNTSAFWALAQARHLPWVVHWHADVAAARMDRALALLYPAYSLLETRLLDRAARVVATSQPYLEASPTLLPWRDKCRVVPLGVDQDRLARPDPERVAVIAQAGGGRPLVLAVGRCAYYKGFEHLVAAMARLPQARLVILGDGPLRPALQAQVHRLGLTDRVALPGLAANADLADHLAACAVFCLPSVERTEAFGVSLLEAMAAGKPLVTTALAGSGVGFVNRPEESGLVVPPGDASALAAALARLLADAPLAQRLGQAGQERFQRDFGIAPVARQLSAVYADVLASPGGSR